MNLYANIGEFKAQMAVHTGDEAAVLSILATASRFVDTFCRRHFFCWEGIRYWDGGKTKLFLPDDILSLSALSTDPNGDCAWANTFAATDYLLYPLNKYPKTQIQLSNNSSYADFAKGLLNAVKGTGVFGFGDGSSRNASPYIANTTVLGTGGITSGAVTHALATGKGALFSAGMTARLESEQVYISGISTDTLTLERGVNGTTAVSHAAGVAFYIYQYHDIVKEATLIQAMKWWKRRESAFATQIGDSTTGTMTIYKGLDPDVKDMLNDSQMRRMI